MKKLEVWRFYSPVAKLRNRVTRDYIEGADTVDDTGAFRGRSTREASISLFVRDVKKLVRDRIDLYTLQSLVSSHVTSTDCYRVFQCSSKAPSF